MLPCVPVPRSPFLPLLSEINSATAAAGQTCFPPRSRPPTCPRRLSLGQQLRSMPLISAHVNLPVLFPPCPISPYLFQGLFLMPGIYAGPPLSHLFFRSGRSLLPRVRTFCSSTSQGFSRSIVVAPPGLGPLCFFLARRDEVVSFFFL